MLAVLVILIEGCHIARPKVFIMKTYIEAIPTVHMEVSTPAFSPLGHIKTCEEVSPFTKTTPTAPTS